MENGIAVIEIEVNTLLEDYIWWATRYSIGSRTYTQGLAMDYAKLIHTNREQFSKDRLRFFARDIRAEISTRVGWSEQVSVENHYNDCIKMDAYKLLMKYLYEHPDTDKERTIFHIDCVRCAVTTEPSEKAYRAESFSEYADWSIMADIIDENFVYVTTEYEGKVATRPAIETYEYDYHSRLVEKVYHPVDEPYRYISKSFITNISHDRE